MTATKHSAKAFILIDPVQDYEESIEIVGIYGSLAAAKMGHKTNWPKRSDPWRDAEVQEWVGDELRNVWRFSKRHGLHPNSWRHEPVQAVSNA